MPRGRKKEKAKCEAVRTDGQKCRAAPLAGKKFCFFHDPKSKRAHRDAASKGGAVQRRPIEISEGEPLSPERSRGILAGAVEAVVSGGLDAGTARAVGYLLQIENRLRESSILTEKIERIEHLAELSRQEREGSPSNNGKKSSNRIAKTMSRLPATLERSAKTFRQELAPKARMVAVLEAHSRGDFAEAERIYAATPKITCRLIDPNYSNQGVSILTACNFLAAELRENAAYCRMLSANAQNLRMFGEPLDGYEDDVVKHIRKMFHTVADGSDDLVANKLAKPLPFTKATGKRWEPISRADPDFVLQVLAPAGYHALEHLRAFPAWENDPDPELVKDAVDAFESLLKPLE